jgi:tetratricopeptide (TPR) repeat protein
MSGRDGISLLAECYEKLGVVAFIRGHLDQAKILAEKSLELFRRSGNKFGIAEAQVNGPYLIALHSGELETARILNESNLAIRHELGDKEGIAYELYNGGVVAISQGDYERARKLYFAAIETCREARSDYLLTGSLGNLGLVYLFKGEKEQAREYFLQVSKLAQEKWEPGHKANSIYWLAMYSFEQKQFRKFIKLNSFLEGKNLLFLYLLFFPMIQTTFHSNVAAARAELGEESFQRAEAEGKTMTLDQALAYALEGIHS